jgi:hypothetical protein
MFMWTDLHSSRTLAIEQSPNMTLEQLARAHDSEPEAYVVVVCDCGTEHGKGQMGCGARWGLEATWSADSAPTIAILSPGHRPTGFDIQEAEERDALGQTELARGRAAAGNWRTGLAALLVLVPTLVVVKGTDAVKDLSNDRRLAIGLLIATGSMIAIVAAIFAMRAAFGPLKRQDLDTKDPGAIRDHEVEITLTYLRVTRWMSIVATVALAAAIAVAWVAPSTSPAFLKVTKATGDVMCGKYAGATTDAILVGIGEGASSIKLPDVKKVAWVTSC